MPEQSLLDRFRVAVERLTAGPPTSDARLGLAVSGGPDSLALLALAAEAYPGAVTAITVDHGLRSEAADEAAHVADICSRLGVPHTIRTPARPIAGNLQSAAREARYALLEEWSEREKLPWIATAHHADDQLETVLMRLLRGSGIDGLSAIRPINGKIIRPLLGVRKAELVSHVESCGLKAVADPSNEDNAFDRVRLRKALTHFPGFDPDRLARSLTATQEASQALGWIVEREARNHVKDGNGSVTLGNIDYPPELLRRLALRCLTRLDPGIQPRGDALQRMVAELSRGKKARIGSLQCEVVMQGGNPCWQFSPAPPRKNSN
jgi:tRNA(Ile)-lysidine synthase